MKPYIKNIHIKDLFHLHGLNISITDEKNPHIIITGKNGSGKTVLLNAISNYLDKIKTDTNFSFMSLEKEVAQRQRWFTEAKNDIEKVKWEGSLIKRENKLNELKGKIDLEFFNISELIKKYNSGDFILAFYEAARKNEITEPKNPTKPNLSQKGKIKDSLISELLKFLSDLKIQEALARNDEKIKEADVFKQWFENFKNVLRRIFDDETLELDFHYQDYTFSIITEGKSFKFTELSDGFRAVLEIVADLILKMQPKGSISSKFNKPGIVLIDEVETHLHLQLQKSILPLLTSLFPNIQFIVTTHSPFVLSSQENAVAYDLEHQKVVDELTEYSYESLAEGYFNVKSDSSYVEMRLKELENLLGKEEKTELEIKHMENLISDFEAIPEPVLPMIKGKFNQLMINYAK
ncbi:MAG: AAA family ATPase [Muribaculaceae bacterium]|nr:AAA family ATPase [Muribaculaceae bacterium]